MKLIGERVLVERVERENTGGFETVDVLDDFVSKGRIVQVGQPLSRGWAHSTMTTVNTAPTEDDLTIGNIILFAKFSPDTQEVKVEGKDMKSVALADIIAIL